MWHLLTIGAMVTCALLAAWQWHRAGSAMGSALNVGYGLQWPLFAVFFGGMWWRMLNMELRRGEQPEHPWDVEPDPEPVVAELVAAGKAETAKAATPSDGPSPFGPRPVRTRPVRDDDDPEMADYNRMLAELTARDND